MPSNPVYQELHGTTLLQRMDNLYYKAGAVKGHFDAYMRRIARPLQTDALVLTAPNKDRRGAEEKLTRGGKAAADPNTLKDIVRGTIKCRTYFAMYLCQQMIHKSPEFKAFEQAWRRLNPNLPSTEHAFKDRFASNSDGPAPSGYRDLNYSVLVGTAGMKFICELQVQIAALNVVKEYEHPIYEIVRLRDKKTGVSVLVPERDKHATGPGQNNISVIGMKLADVQKTILNDGSLGAEDQRTLASLVEKFYPGGMLTNLQLTFEKALLDKVDEMLPRLYEEYNKRAVASGFISVVEYQKFMDDKNLRLAPGRSGISALTPAITAVNARTGTRDDTSVRYGSPSGQNLPGARGPRESPF